MLSVPFASLQIGDFLHITMISRDHQRTTGLEDSGDESRQALVGGFDRFDRGSFIAGVADHVWIGIVHEDEIIDILLDFLITMSVTSGALISGCSSKCATVGEGIRMRSSSGKASSLPPLKK